MPRQSCSSRALLTAFYLLVGQALAPLHAQETDAPVLPGHDLKELARKARRSVVAIHLFDRFGRALGGGSGFFATADGLVVTNYHVVEPILEYGGRLEVELTEPPLRYDVEMVVARDERNDLAVLRLKEVPSSSPPLQIELDFPEVGEQVAVFGSPQGLSGSLSVGFVSAVRIEPEDFPEGHEAPLLQIDAAISRGSSGSPVMDLEGDVLGVAVSTLLGGQNLNFAVPAPAVRELLATVDAGSSPVVLNGGRLSNSPSFLRNLIVSAVFFLALWVGFRLLR